jgi:hypothetical protein
LLRIDRKFTLTEGELLKSLRQETMFISELYLGRVPSEWELVPRWHLGIVEPLRF